MIEKNEIKMLHGLPHPDWDLIHQRMDALPCEKLDEAYSAIVCDWLNRLAAALGENATVHREADTLLLSLTTDDQPERLLAWSRRTIGRITALLGEHRTPAMAGPRVILLFSDHERYYDYIDRHFPDGEYGASGGVFISHGYMHVVIGPGDFGTRQMILAHELTHYCLGPLAIPTWLNEGLAQVMGEIITGISNAEVYLDVATCQRAHWLNEGLQSLWTGESFSRPDESSVLSYFLAYMLVRQILSDHPDRVSAFLAKAHWSDAGNGAARGVFGRGVGELAAGFLGQGNWDPEPVPDRNSLPPMLVRNRLSKLRDSRTLPACR